MSLSCDGACYVDCSLCGCPSGSYLSWVETNAPTSNPIIYNAPSGIPTLQPSREPTANSSDEPSGKPTTPPSNQPSSTYPTLVCIMHQYNTIRIW